jgi:hypothetical protein
MVPTGVALVEAAATHERRVYHNQLFVSSGRVTARLGAPGCPSQRGG